MTNKNSSNQRTQWDIYEAVVLLNGYLKVVEKNISKSRVIKRISECLRKMALNRGISIDEKFRNEASITYQIKSMESAYKGHTVSVPATHLFIETVKLYRNNIKEYKSILKKAHAMILGNQLQDSTKISAEKLNSKLLPNADNFYLYLRDEIKVAPRTCAAYVSAIKSSERYAQEHGYSHCCIYSKNISDTIATVNLLYSDAEFINLNAEQHNRFSAAINRLVDFIGVNDQIVNYGKSNRANSQTLYIQHGKKDLSNYDHITQILKEHFEYGYRSNSKRECLRFRQYADEINIELPESDEDLQRAIISVGILIGEKVFYKNDVLLSDLQKIVNKITKSGSSVIYYEALFNINYEWMSEHFITSEELLKSFLQICISNFSFSKKFMSLGEKISERVAVESEIKRVWNDNPTAQIEELSMLLPYIPIEYIYRTLSGNANFVWVSEGAYLRLDKFVISEADKKAVTKFVENQCQIKSYASLTDIPLGNIENENIAIPLHSLYNAVYNILLADKYSLNGKILTIHNNCLDAVSILKQQISDLNTCSFEEISDRVVELTGSTNRQLAFQALYDCMVRVDKSKFVSIDSVKFDIDEIDNILSKIITNRFCSIKEITTFVMFPLCGQNWNHYLLESYCFKFSQKYNLLTIYFNDKNAGIIAEKNLDKKYEELLAIYLSKTDLELSPEVIGSHLCKCGYTAKSKYAWLADVASAAQKLRKE